MSKEPYSHLPASVVAALPELRGGTVKVAVALGSFFDGQGEGFPGREAIKERAGLGSMKTINRGLAELVRKGLLIRRRRRRQSNMYAWADNGAEAEEGAQTTPSRPAKTGHKLPHQEGQDRALLASEDRAQSAPQKVPINVPKQKTPAEKSEAGKSLRQKKPTTDKPPVGKGTGREQRKAGQESKSNGWALWVDANRDAGKSDPLPTGADTKASQRLVKLIPDRDQLSALMAAFVRDADPFLVRQGHALRLLEGRINAYRGKKTDGQERSKYAAAGLSLENVT